MAEEPTFGLKTLKHTEKPAPAVKKDAPAAAKSAAAAAHPAFGAGAFKAANEQPQAADAETSQSQASTAQSDGPKFGVHAQPSMAPTAEELNASKVSAAQNGISDIFHRVAAFLNRDGWVFWVKYYLLSFFFFHYFRLLNYIPVYIPSPVTNFIWRIPRWYVILCLLSYPVFVLWIRTMTPKKKNMLVNTLFGVAAVHGELDPRYWLLRSVFSIVKFVLSGVLGGIALIGLVLGMIVTFFIG